MLTGIQKVFEKNAVVVRSTMGRTAISVHICWNDLITNVVVGSHFAGVKCTNTFKRYDLVQKKVKIDCSDMVSQYKQWMGGVDLVDMLIALCRTHIMIRRRWHLKIIFHCFDIAKVIGWFLYRRHCQQKDDSEKFQISLTTFTTQIAPAFILAGKDPQKNRWSAKMQHFSETSSQKKSSCSITSGRHPIWKNGALSWNWCQKCNVGLCLNKVRNCFKDFHH